MASKSDLARLVKARGRAAQRGWIGCILVLIALGCSKKEAAPGTKVELEDRPETLIYTVNYPLAYFAKRLAPEATEVVFPAPPDVDPASWKPSPEVIARYQKADLILLNGAGYARWTQYATLPKARTVVTAEDCRKTFLQNGDAVKHQHGPDGEHAHEGTAFTTWLDMRLALCQAERIRDALIQLAPTRKNAVQQRFAALERDLTRLDARLGATAKAWGDQRILASHPVYQYLEHAYGLRIESLHFEPDQSLGPEAVQELDSLVASQPAKLMLWEAQPLPETEQLLRRRGITTVVFDPISQPPSKGDFLTVMADNAGRLACAAGTGDCP